MTEQARATESPAETWLRKQFAAPDQRLTQYRAALNAGADAVVRARDDKADLYPNSGSR